MAQPEPHEPEPSQPEPAGLSRVLTLDGPLDLALTVGPLRHGGADPTIRIAPGQLWRACASPVGDLTVQLVHQGPGEVRATAWGAGAQWALDRLPHLIGAHDDWSSLELTPELAAVAHRHPGLRLPATGLVMDSLVPAIIEQRVTGMQAFSSWRRLVHFHGRRAPGPGRLWIAPTPAQLLEITSWRWQQLGVEAKRVRAIRAACTVASRMDEAAELAPDQAMARLQLVPGIGPWTAAEALQRAMGHPDAVSVGDYHLADHVVHFFTGAARGSDEQMLELLAPWTGQRQRVVRLIELSGVRKPKFGPRYAPLDISTL